MSRRNRYGHRPSLGFGFWLALALPLFGAFIMLDLIGSHLIGYGRQKVEILSIVDTRSRKVPFRLNYRTRDGTVGHMAWPHGKPGQELCKPGMLIDAVVNFSAGTVDVTTCAYPDDSRETP